MWAIKVRRMCVALDCSGGAFHKVPIISRLSNEDDRRWCVEGGLLVLPLQFFV